MSLKIFILLLFIIPINAKGQYTDSLNLDQKIIISINNDHTQFTDGFFKSASKSMFPIVIVSTFSFTAYGILSNSNYDRNTGISIAVSSLAALFSTEGLKLIFERERPCQEPILSHYLRVVSGTRCPRQKDYSFPSGHSATAFAFATSISLYYPKWYVIGPSYAYALLVAYSRMYLGVHFLTDVLAGAVVGTGIGILSHSIIK